MYVHNTGFIFCMLPYLEKLAKPNKEEPKTKGESHVGFKIEQRLSNTCLDQFIGGRDELMDITWDKMYYEFKKLKLYPTHYRKFVQDKCLVLQLIIIEKE